jgi:polysaccharide export outer membrane protein
VTQSKDEPLSRHGFHAGVWSMVLGATALFAGGCETNSFFDPSKTGYFGSTPVTMPVLDRIAAIEPSVDLWGETTQVTAQDLMASDLSYRLHPGDMVEIRIYELYTKGQFFPVTGRVDQAGDLHIPELGSVPAAGLTVPQLQEELVARLSKQVMKNPTVTVNLGSGGALTYIIYGHVNRPARFTLEDPTLRLLDALTMAGGVPLSTRRIYVVRQVSVDPSLHSPWHPDKRGETTSPRGSSSRPSAPVDIESLIDQLQDTPGGTGSAPAPAAKPSPRPSPGAWAAAGDPPIDVEDVTPATAALPTVKGPGHATTPGGNNPFVYLPDQDKWARTRQTATPPAETDPAAGKVRSSDLVVERVIEVPYQQLTHGDTSLNLVIRPGDQIYVDGPPTGYCYVSGEVRSPNAYPLPAADPMTLSRLIAMAGGLGPLAIPDRVDLVRQVDEGREATIRLDLAAIRRRTEPDIVIKPNDHVLVGTNWFAYPLAVFRNGFRINYGFGFLMDRNFGNDVFGPPPTNIGR